MLEEITALQQQDYVPILHLDHRFYGGSQEWFAYEKKIIAKAGCGLIALCDLTLYLARSNAQYHTPLIRRMISNLSRIPREEYLRYVLTFDKICLGLSHEIGINGIALGGALDAYARGYRLPLRAKWHVKKGSAILVQIQNMLNNDMPVILSVGKAILHRHDAGVYLYTYDAKADAFEPCRKRINAHYMVVTALCTHTSAHGQHRFMLRVSSWAQCYYIDLQEYIRYCERFYGAKWFSNILVIKHTPHTR